MQNLQSGLAAQEQPAILSRQYRISFITNAIVIFIALLGLIGMAFNIPKLYFWRLGETAMPYQSAILLILLSIGYGSQIIPICLQKPFSRWIGILCFGSVFLFALSEIVAFIMSGQQLTLKEFLEPSNPFKGHISFYAALGFVLASASSFFIFTIRTEKYWNYWLIQVWGILLINLTAFGFAENLAALPIARFFTSVPASVGLFCYGIALLFYPGGRLHLVTPFFSTSLLTRFYAYLLWAVWLALLIWQASWANAYLGVVHLLTARAHTMVVFDELLEVVLFSFILGLGLHILGTLDQNTRLMQAYQQSEQRLEESFDRYAMLAATNP
jgi:hypothetical protein